MRITLAAALLALVAPGDYRMDPQSGSPLRTLSPRREVSPENLSALSALSGEESLPPVHAPVIGEEPAPGDGIKVGEIDSLKKVIKPRAEETKWEEIPWMVDLWEARRKAAKAGKPLMLWEMDGNPMGCG